MTEPLAAPSLPPKPSCVGPLLAWVLAGAFMLAFAHLAAVSRTQEARVLETAREMVGRPFVDWMIPHTNGDIRLHKPPLAYWLSAGMYQLLGISAWTGRLPMVVSGWLTLGFTYLIAKRLFDRMAALFAAAALIGSYLFFKSTLLAETDILATFFVTAGVYGVLRAIEKPKAIGWQHFIGLCMGLAVMAKGPPAAYIAGVGILLCAFRRDWRALGWFFASGAVVTFLIIAVPWFAYIFEHGMKKQLLDDLRNSAEGGKGHASLPHVYIPMFAQSIAPYTAVWVVAIAAALRHVGRRLKPWGGVDSIFTLLLWGLVIGLPLMGWGNKQIHYLLPLMPPTMILVGYGMAGAIRGRGRFAELSRIVLIVTTCLLGLLPLVPILIARVTRDHGEIWPVDYLACGVLVAAGALAFWLARNTGPNGLGRAMAVMGVALVATIAWEGKTVETWPTQDLARELYRVHPKANYVFRNEASLSLCFEMGKIIPPLTDDQITKRMNEKNLYCLERDEGKSKLGPPDGWVEVSKLGTDEKWLKVYAPNVPTAQ